MKKIVFSLVTVLTLVLGGTVAFAGEMGGDGSSNYGGSNQGQTTPGNQMSRTVIIQNFAFVPANITVAQGATVTWVNHDTTAHTVTTNTATGPMSGRLEPGQSYSYTFAMAGTFGYHCSIHPTMTGMVTVVATPPNNNPHPPSTPPTNGGAMTQPPSSSGGNSSSNSTSSANSSSTATVNNYNTYNSTTKAATSAPTPTPPQAPPAQTAPAPPIYTEPGTPTAAAPSTPTYVAASTPATPTTLPNTGAAGALISFVAAVILGSGVYYLYARRKAPGA